MTWIILGVLLIAVLVMFRYPLFGLRETIDAAYEVRLMAEPIG